MNIAEILRKLADVVDGQTTGGSATAITNRPGADSEPVAAPEPEGGEDHAVINVKPMVPPLQQKLELMKRMAGVEGEEDTCPHCHANPCECEHESENEMAILKRNAGITPLTIAIADEDEPFEG
jgi:hypothetical protein